VARAFRVATWLDSYDKLDQDEWLDSYDKLDQDHLPPYNEWYSSLKGKNIEIEDYEYCKEVWNTNNMTSMKDFSRWYNNWSLWLRLSIKYLFSIVIKD
jgi:hypothetical protein